MSEELIENHDIDVTNIEEWKIDKLVEEVKQNNIELERYKEIKDRRIEEINHQYEVKKEKILKENHFKLTTLREYAMMQKDSLKSTKTQFKLPMLSGDIVIKKPTQKVPKPTKEKYEEIEKVYPEFVEKVEDKKVNWKELKKQLIIQNNEIYDKDTGEQVSNLFDIEVSDEETIVK